MYLFGWKFFDLKAIQLSSAFTHYQIGQDFLNIELERTEHMCVPCRTGLDRTEPDQIRPDWTPKFAGPAKDLAPQIDHHHPV